MRKHIKTLICLSFVAVLAVLGGFFATNFSAPEVSAQEVSTNAESDFTISGGMITGYKGTSMIVEIPSTINGETVKGIGANAFSSKSISSVTLPSTCITIEQRAFYNCSTLNSISGISAITKIGDYAFYGCRNLNLSQPLSSCTTIGNHAFYNCSRITSMSNLRNLSTIGNNAFANCSNLQNISDLNYVTTIGDYAFQNCTMLQSFSGSFQNLRTIGQRAFYGCSNLTNIGNINYVTTIGEYAFYNCQRLRLNQSFQELTSLGRYAFAKCTSIEYFATNKLTTIPEYAFTESKIRSFVFNYQLTKIEHGAFYKAQVANIGRNGNNNYFQVQSFISSDGFVVDGLVTTNAVNESTNVYKAKTLILIEFNFQSYSNIKSFTTDPSLAKYYAGGVFAGLNFGKFTITDTTNYFYPSGNNTTTSSVPLTYGATFDELYYNVSNQMYDDGSWTPPFDRATIKYLEIGSTVLSIDRDTFYATQIDTVKINSENTSFESGAFSPSARSGKKYRIDKVILEYKADSSSLSKLKYSGLFETDGSGNIYTGSVYFTTTLSSPLLYTAWPTGEPWDYYNKLSNTVSIDGQKYIVYSQQTATATINASATTGGTISPSGSIKVPMYDSVKFTIKTSEAKYKLKNVTVNGVSKGVVNSLEVYADDSNISVVATFEIKKFTISATAGTGGTITPSGSATVEYGQSSATYKITPNEGYRIKDVKTGTTYANTSQGAIEEYTFTNVTTNKCISATFEKIPYTITSSAGEGGSIIPAGATTVLHGSAKAYTITPQQGYEVDKLIIDGVETTFTSSPYTFSNVTADHTIDVTFKKLKYTITATAGTGGKISPSGTTEVEYGDEQAYTITPNQGYEVDKLTVDGSEVTAATTYTFSEISANHTIDVTFKLQTFTITATALEGGTITPEGETTVEYGKNSPTYKITPNPGYVIYEVYVNNEGQGVLTEITLENVTQDYTIHAAFVVQEFTITATAGEGGTISPSGEMTVDYGASQTFTISASTGYQIKDVTVNGISKGAVSSLSLQNITADQEVIATFTKIQYTITATAGANGSISPAGDVKVEHGKSQTFTFTPNKGYVVKEVKVDGTVVGNETSYTISNVTANKEIHVEFEIKTFIITATAGANGKISPAGEVVVNYDGSQTFTFTPDTGYAVKSILVNDFDVGPDDSYTLYSIKGNLTIHVEFEIKQFTITASAGAGGTISPSGDVNVEYGKNQTFTITPSTGFEVDDVLIDDVSIGERTTYTFSGVTADHTIDVTFRTKTLTISATAGEGGTISPSGTSYVNYGSNKTFTITPNTNYQIKQITVNGVVKTNTTSLVLENIKENQIILVTFEKITYTITATAGENGSISPSGKIVVEIGEDTPFTFTPDTGYQVKDVKINGLSVGAVSEYTITDIARNTTIYVEFEIQTFTISAKAGTGGTITPSGEQKVNYGASQTFTISANVGYEIASVKVDGTNKGAIESFTFSNVTSDHKIEATFTKIKYTITATAGVGGTISPTGKIAVDHGANQKFTITPIEGYEIASIKVDGEYKDIDSTYTFTNVTQAHAIEVQFIKIKYTITATAGENGTITPNGQFSVAHGESQTFKFTPDTGYTVKDVKVNQKSVGAVDEYTISNIKENTTIHVDFEQKGYTITTKTDGNGTFSPSGNVNVLYGEDQTFEIIANKGYVVKDVLVDGESVGALTSYTFEAVGENHTISATFEKLNFTITATAGSNGTITPNGEIIVEYGDSQTFEIAPNEGYKISEIRVDGELVAITESLSFENIESSHTIAVKFERKTYTITATAGENGSISFEGEQTVQHGDSKTYTFTPNDGYIVYEVVVDGQVVDAIESYTFNNIVEDHTISVTFKVLSYTITTTCENGGTINPNGKVWVEHGKDQTFDIQPNEGYEIEDVLVDGESVGAQSSYTFEVVTKEHTISVTFKKIKYTITATAGEHGTITPNGEFTVEYGDSQTFEFAPDLGYAVKQVVVNGSEVEFENDCYTISKITENIVINVEFEQRTYIITASAGENGSISPSGRINVVHGETKEFIITPDYGYQVCDIIVDGEVVEDAEAYTFDSISDNHTIEVTFEIKRFTIIATAGEGGTISPSGEISLKAGETQDFVITPNQGYKVKKLVSNGEDMGAPLSYSIINIQEDYIVVVEFEKLNFTITATAGENGTITPNGEVSVAYAEDKTFEFVPNVGYKVVDVKVDGESVGVANSYTFESVSQDHTISVSFEKITYIITATAGEHGTITPDGEVVVEYGETKTFGFVPNAGYMVDEVRVDGVKVEISDSKYMLTNITENHTISVTFKIQTFTLTATCTFGGTINPSGVATVSYGESKTYTITPMNGYEVSSIKINNQEVEKTTTLSLDNIAEDKTIEVVFEKIKYTITVISGEHGNITPQTQQVEHGSSITFMISPNADSQIADVKVDGESKGVITIWTFENVEANHTIEATFVEKTEFKVVISCGENGNITPNNISNLEKGASQTFTLSPNKGYVVKEVRVNGTRVSVSNNTFVVENVQSDLSIEVSFMKKAQTGDATIIVIIFAVIVLGVSGVVIFFVVKSTKIKKLEK